ncbi:MAG: hypothetical protein GY696_34100, partial [Gammaproteobacteria bacterium]|nr:hypothetical protein [Gammaproteobacteria bacterium]
MESPDVTNNVHESEMRIQTIGHSTEASQRPAEAGPPTSVEGETHVRLGRPEEETFHYTKLDNLSAERLVGVLCPQEPKERSPPKYRDRNPGSPPKYG